MSRYNSECIITNERRLRLRPWILSKLESNSIVGLEWRDKGENIFKIPWYHSGKNDWSSDTEQVFRAWAIYTGKYSEGIDKPQPTKWKSNLRCALHKAKDIQELTEPADLEHLVPFRCYKFLKSTKNQQGKEPHSLEAGALNIPSFVKDYVSSDSSDSSGLFQRFSVNSNPLTSEHSDQALSTWSNPLLNQSVEGAQHISVDDISGPANLSDDLNGISEQDLLRQCSENPMISVDMLPWSNLEKLFYQTVQCCKPVEQPTSNVPNLIGVEGTDLLNEWQKQSINTYMYSMPKSTIGPATNVASNSALPTQQNTSNNDVLPANDQQIPGTVLLPVYDSYFKSSGSVTRRLRLRPWILSKLESNSIVGLEWRDKQANIFKIPWFHSGKIGWSSDKEQVFREWAIHTGKYSEGIDKPNPLKWKTNLRCALNKDKDIQEVKESDDQHLKPFRCYKMFKIKNKHIPIEVSDKPHSLEAGALNIPLFVKDYISSDSCDSSGSFQRDQTKQQLSPISDTDSISVTSSPFKHLDQALSNPSSNKSVEGAQHMSVEDISGPVKMSRDLKGLSELDFLGQCSQNQSNIVIKRSNNSPMYKPMSTICPATNVAINYAFSTHNRNDVSLFGMEILPEFDTYEQLATALPVHDTANNNVLLPEYSKGNAANNASNRNQVKHKKKIEQGIRYEKFSTDTLFSHACKPPYSGSEMYIELVYKNNIVEHWHVNNPNGCLLFFNKTIQDCMRLEDFYGEGYEPRTHLKMPAWPNDLSNNVSNNATKKAHEILNNSERGVVLECNNGNITIIRNCNAILYTSCKTNPKISRKDDRLKTTIFDFKNEFLNEFDKYTHQISTVKPQSHVHIYFGQRGEGPHPVDILVMLRVTSCRALHKLERYAEDNKKRASINVPFPDQQDQMLKPFKYTGMIENQRDFSMVHVAEDTNADLYQPLYSPHDNKANTSKNTTSGGMGNQRDFSMVHVAEDTNADLYQPLYSPHDNKANTRKSTTSGGMGNQRDFSMVHVGEDLYQPLYSPHDNKANTRKNTTSGGMGNQRDFSMVHVSEDLYQPLYSPHDNKANTRKNTTSGGMGNQMEFSMVHVAEDTNADLYQPLYSPHDNDFRDFSMVHVGEDTNADLYQPLYSPHDNKANTRKSTTSGGMGNRQTPQGNRPKPTDVRCEYCLKVFSNGIFLRKHKNRAHPNADSLWHMLKSDVLVSEDGVTSLDVANQQGHNKVVSEVQESDRRKKSADLPLSIDGEKASHSCSEVIVISNDVSAFLKNGRCKQRLLLEIQRQDAVAGIGQVEEGQLKISAVDELNLQKAIQIINTAIEAKTIHTYQLYRDVFTSDRWRRLCDKIHADHQGEVLVMVDDVTSEIKIVGFTKIIPRVAETIQRFMTREQFDRKKGSPFFHRGDVTTWQWTEEEKKHLTETSAMRVLYIGEYLAGKTSLVRTILSGDSYLTHIDDRTVIAEHNHWTHKSNKNSTFSLVDLGGHQSYQSSGHFFHCNSRNNIATLCHDVTSKGHRKSFVWLKSVLTRSPKCHIAIALTKCDLISEQEGKSRLKTFQDKLLVFLKREIVTLECSVWMAESSNSSKLPSFIALRDRYQWIVDHIADITVLVSSEQGYEHTVTKLTDRYVELSEKPENKVLLPKHFQSFFSVSGNVGKMIEDDEVEMPHMQQEGPVHEILGEKDEAPKSIISTLPEGETNTISGSKPVSLEEQQPKEGSKTLPYMTLDTAKEVYNKALRQHNLPESTDLKSDTQRCLGSLHEHGLMIYYGIGVLENIVFNNINAFVAILRSVFNHNVPEFQNFHKVPVKYRCQFYNNEESLFTDEVKLLHSQGLMSIQLLTILLHGNNCRIDPQAIIELLDLLEIGFSFIPESIDTKYSFIPFFIEKKQPFDDIKQEIEKVGKCDSQSLSIHSQIRGNLSLSLWHYLVVRFCKKLYDDNMQHREIWRNGFFASVGQFNIKLLLLYNDDDVIDMKVRGTVTTTAGHEMMWKFVRLLNSEINGLMSDWWPGLVTAKVVLCTHCVIRGVENCSENRLEQVLEDKNCVNDTCCCQAESCKQLPSALLMPLPLDAETASVRISSLTTYLQEAFAEAKCDDNTQVHPNTSPVTVPEIQRYKTVGFALSSDHKLTQDKIAYISHRLAPSVCRIVYPGMTGTGFVVGCLNDESTNLPHRLILSCHHTKIQDAIRNQQQCTAEFGFHERTTPAAVTVTILPFAFAQNEQLDYVLLCLEHSPQLETHLATAVNLANLIRPDRPNIKDPLVIIGHPEGMELKVDPSAYCDDRPCIQSTEVNFDACIFYQCCTYAGGSGSPCFSAHKELLHAMHRGGNISGPARHVAASSCVEHGVLLWDIIRDIALKVVGQQQQNNSWPCLKPEGIHILFPQVFQ